MTLEEKIKLYADRGELTHLSLAYSQASNEWHVNLALSSPPAGYTSVRGTDPIAVMLEAFDKAPVKLRAKKITAAVTEETLADKPGLPGDWTTP